MDLGECHQTVSISCARPGAAAISVSLSRTHTAVHLADSVLVSNSRKASCLYMREFRPSGLPWFVRSSTHHRQQFNGRLRLCLQGAKEIVCIPCADRDSFEAEVVKTERAARRCLQRLRLNSGTELCLGMQLLPLSAVRAI